MSTESSEKPICFVVMPISDPDGYAQGHFARVYEHLLKPAIVAAGYEPVRADDTNKTDYIVVGIIKRVVESAIVLCDYSSRNPNVMYELGIRHAFNLPVVLIKDRATEKVFDIQGLRYIEYDETLRVDTVQRDMLKISKAMKETMDSNDGTVNSVVHLAGVTPAKVPDAQAVTGDTQLILSALTQIESRISNLEGERIEFVEHIMPTRGRMIEVQSDGVVLSDGIKASIGDQIWDPQGQFSGVLEKISPTTQRVAIKTRTGLRWLSFSSPAMRRLESTPF